MGKASKENRGQPSRLKLKKGSQNKEAGVLPERSRFNRPLIHSLLIFLIALLAYSNTFYSPFQWDEDDFIVKNPIIKNLEHFLRPAEAKGLDPDYYIFLKTRYVGYLTFALNYKIHGFDVLGYHLFNLTIHILNGILVYFLVLSTLRTPFLTESSLNKKSTWIALFSSLVFTSHPLQTEAVTYIFQRQASLVTFFYLLSIVSYSHWRLRKEEKKESRLHSTAFLYCLSVASAILAMKTKENAFTLPVIILVYEFFFFSGPIKIRILYLLPLLLTLTIIPYTLIGIDRPFEETVSKILDPSLLLTGTVSREAYLFTQFRVILTYIRLLFLPIQQNLDYDFPTFSSFFMPQVFLSLLFHLAMLGLGVYAFRLSRRSLPDWRFISFGIFWFFIALSVESSIIPLQMILCEYRVYLPSVGAFTAIAASLFILVEKLGPKFPKAERPMAFLGVFVVVLLMTMTYARNSLWVDRITLWEDVTRKSPGNTRAHYNLGLAYGKQERLGEAAREFQVTLRLDPNHKKARNNLGLVYHRQGRIDDAIKEFQTVLKLNPKDADVYYNLGVVFAQQNRFDEALSQFQISLNFDPYKPETHNNLGVIFVQQGRLNDAIREFQAALKLNPDHVSAQSNLRKAVHLKSNDRHGK